MEYGCYVDGSHWSAYDLDRRICQFAADMGWQLDSPRDEDYEGWRWCADEAVDWLNDTHSQEGDWWFIADNSLYYSEDTEA